MSEAPVTRERWHVGKEVPLAFIFAVLLQTGIAIWWASSQSEFSKNNHNDIVNLQKGQLMLMEQQQRRDQEGATVSQAVKDILSTLQDIKQNIRDMRQPENRN